MTYGIIVDNYNPTDLLDELHIEYTQDLTDILTDLMFNQEMHLELVIIRNLDIADALPIIFDMMTFGTPYSDVYDIGAVSDFDYEQDSISLDSVNDILSLENGDEFQIIIVGPNSNGNGLATISEIWRDTTSDLVDADIGQSNIITYGTVAPVDIQLGVGNKTIQSLYIRNKEVKSIMRKNGDCIYGAPTGIKLAFGQEEYTSATGSMGITCQLTDYDNNDIANKTITLTGTDGSHYTETTNSEGIASFSLVGKGDSITYTATYDTESAECIVHGLNNKIRLYVDCTRITQKKSGESYYTDTLRYTISYATKSSDYERKIETDYNIRQTLFEYAPLNVTVLYGKKNNVSASDFTNQTKDVRITTTDTITSISFGNASMTSEYKNMLKCKNSSNENYRTNGNWKFAYYANGIYM